MRFLKARHVQIFCDSVYLIFLRLSDKCSIFQLYFVRNLKTINNYDTREKFLHSDSKNDGKNCNGFYNLLNTIPGTRCKFSENIVGILVCCDWSFFFDKRGSISFRFCIFLCLYVMHPFFDTSVPISSLKNVISPST